MMPAGMQYGMPFHPGTLPYGVQRPGGLNMEGMNRHGMQSMGMLPQVGSSGPHPNPKPLIQAQLMILHR